VPQVFGSQFDFLDFVNVVNLKIAEPKMLDNAQDAHLMLPLRT
jgi:hypothetical protein